MAGSGRTERARSGTAAGATAGALKALAAARRARETAEASERDAIRAAREAGVSWSKIGGVYGLTKQGAQQRFKPLLDAGREPVDDPAGDRSDDDRPRPAAD